MRTADLFAGCGGLSLGFLRAGYRLVAAIDSWEAARRCYEANLPGHPFFQMDLSKTEEALEVLRPLAPQVVIGGPPCQDFSQAGKRTEGDRADLTVRFALLVARLAPQAFVFENVEGALFSKAYAEARRYWREAGYGLTEVVLDAAFYGVPQRRRRLFAIGIRRAEDGLLAPHLEHRASPRPLTLREYAGDRLPFQYYYRHPRNYERRGIFSVDEPAPTVRGTNRPLPPGYRKHPKDPVAPFPGLRAMTPEERALVQTFPEGWRWPGTKSQVELLVGNAVPPQLAFHVASALREVLESLVP